MATNQHGHQNHQPIYALVRLADDPCATILYVPLYAFYQHAHIVSKHQIPQKSMPCFYTPHHHLPVNTEHAATVPLRRAFNQIHAEAVYNVHILATFPALISSRKVTHAELVDDGDPAPTTHHVATQFLCSLRDAKQLSKPRMRNNALRSLHAQLMQHHLPTLLVEHYDDIFDTIAHHLFATVERKSRTHAAELAAIVQLQLVADATVEHSTRFAMRVIPILRSIVFNSRAPPDTDGPAVRAACCAVLGTMQWCCGAPDICALAEILAGLARIAIDRRTTTTEAEQCASLDALALLVTLLPAAHIEHMWPDGSAPVVISLSDALSMMRDDNRGLAVRLRVAWLIAILLEHGRRHETGFAGDKVPEICEVFMRCLDEKSMARRSKLCAPDQSRLLMIVRSVEYDLQAETLHCNGLQLDTWAAHQQHRALRAAFGEDIDSQLRTNVTFQSALQLIDALRT